jgi:adenosylcobyric acid synthase
MMKAIMVVGTTSHAGKSLLTAAICRILSRQGFRVTPFKGQNMALNSYVTANGGEIAYSQAMQSWAAGVSPRVEMNPILLKPQGNMTSQVILNGHAVGYVNAKEYYEKYFDIGWKTIQQSLQILGQSFDVIVGEGAGSPAEINLKHRDLTNMRLAKYLNAKTILVADIDRGGVFAHIVGTLELLEPDERSLIKGIIINKFRGDISILQPGIDWLENRTGIPVIGVIPMIEELFSAEDSLDLLERRQPHRKTDITIGVIRLPRIANFTDFEPLEAEATVKLEYIGLKENLNYPNALIIPGSKTTIPDLMALQESGMAKQIQAYVTSGGTVLGICGGLQMLGEIISDPSGLEGMQGDINGLGLLPLKTVIVSQKITRQRQVISNHPQEGLPVSGYEIHQGRTTLLKPEGITQLFEDKDLGYVNQYQSIWGTYLHGIFDNGAWRRSWLNHLRQQRGLPTLATGIPNYREQREVLLDKLASVVASHLDLKSIL